MNYIRTSLEELLNKEVDRREFLLHVAAAGASVIGISALIKSLTTPHEKPQSRTSGGYGGSAYGK